MRKLVSNIWNSNNFWLFVSIAAIAATIWGGMPDKYAYSFYRIEDSEGFEEGMETTIVIVHRHKLRIYGTGFDQVILLDAVVKDKKWSYMKTIAGERAMISKEAFILDGANFKITYYNPRWLTPSGLE